MPKMNHAQRLALAAHNGDRRDLIFAVSQILALDREPFTTKVDLIVQGILDARELRGNLLEREN